jgi:hypothetical protein
MVGVSETAKANRENWDKLMLSADEPNQSIEAPLIILSTSS